MKSTQCQKIKRNGQQCAAHAMTDSEFCFMHEPRKAAERAAARRAGGLERSRRIAVLPADTPDRLLRSGGDVAELLRDMINKILKGELDPKIGYAVGYLSSLKIKLFEQRAMEERLAALEAIVKQRPVEPDLILADETETSGVRR